MIFFISHLFSPYRFTMIKITNNIRFFSIFQTIYGTDAYGI
jgi:hypothetical protein